MLQNILDYQLQVRVVVFVVVSVRRQSIIVFLCSQEVARLPTDESNGNATSSSSTSSTSTSSTSSTTTTLRSSKIDANATTALRRSTLTSSKTVASSPLA
jgi:hypothetical protein